MRAYILFQLAADSGHAEAAKNLETVAKRMSGAEIDAAKMIVAGCKQGKFKQCD